METEEGSPLCANAWKNETGFWRTPPIVSATPSLSFCVTPKPTKKKKKESQPEKHSLPQNLAASSPTCWQSKEVLIPPTPPIPRWPFTGVRPQPNHTVERLMESSQSRPQQKEDCSVANEPS